MADVITKTRTNYFKTTDPEALKALVNGMKTDGAPAVLVENEKSHEFMFYCNGELQGTLTDRAKRHLEDDPDWADDNPDEAWSMDVFRKQLQALVAPGDACVIKTVGYEAMRCLFADADIITRDKMGYANLDDVLTAKARSQLSDNNWNTVYEG